MINKSGHYELIVREAYPYLAIPVIICMLCWWFGYALLSSLFLIISISIALFFRNPSRLSPSDDGSLLSPADGVVDEVATNIESSELGPGSMTRICIFMSIFNVHVNRAPITGEVTKIRYQPGVFLDAREQAAWTSNEQNALIIQGNNLKIEVIQVAGKVARRISCWVREGELVQRGKRFGLVHFGSKLVVYCPKDYIVTVSEGTRVKAGLSVIARPPKEHPSNNASSAAIDI
jgi:phosphatidylserine decarboxylase